MNFDISPVAAVQNVVALHNARTANEAQLLMYAKTLEIVSESASNLIDALPQPALATSGSLGTRLNVYA